MGRSFCKHFALLMNILTLTVGFPKHLSGATISGEVKNAYTLIKLLERREHRVYVVSAPTIWQPSAKTISDPYLRNSPQGLGRGVVRYLTRAILMTPDVYSFLRNNRIDVIHCHSPVQLLAVWLATVICRECRNISVFVTAHGTYLPEFNADVGSSKGLRTYLKKLNSRVQYSLDKFMYRQFSKVIVTSSFQIKEMKDIYELPEKKLCIINNPAAVYFDKAYRNGERAKFRKFKSSTEFTKLLFVGRFVKKKGLLNLIQAVGVLTRKKVNVHLTCVGGGMVDEHMMSEINEFIHKKGLNQNIDFKGEVSELTLARLYRDCDCLVVPSIGYESIPTVVIEGIKSGIKVFATGKWGITEVLISRDCWLKEDSVDDIVEKLSNFSPQNGRVDHEFLKRLDGDEITSLHEKLFKGT